jgi:RNA polymerase sigma-70 factor (ECF subfamily)
MAHETGVLDHALARASTGDEAGFLELWRALQPRLLRFLRAIGCDDADDVASETWLQVVRDLRKFSGGEDDFRRWLFTIGRHRAIDAARARARRPASPMMNSGLDILADSQIVEDEVLDGMSVQGAVALLAGLSRDQAEAVALRVIAGLETPDVARILGKSAGAVRVALHRGLKTLADDPAVRAMASRQAGRSAGAAAPAAGEPGLTLGTIALPGLTGPGSPRGPEPDRRTLEEVD